MYLCDWSRLFADDCASERWIDRIMETLGSSFPILNDSEIQQDNDVSISRAKSNYLLLCVCLPISVSVLNASNEYSFTQLMH